MKRIICAIRVTDAQDSDISLPLDLVPGATFESKTKDGDDGPEESITLSFRTHWDTKRLDILKRELIIKVWFDDDTHRTVGTTDYPATLAITQADTLDCKCEWRKAI